MRKLGALPDETSARRLVDYLLTQQILATTNVSADADEGWELWVREEDQLDAARQILSQYRSNPDDARYSVAKQASQIRKQLEVAIKKRAKLQRGMPRSGIVGIRDRSIPLTIGFIVIAVVCALLTNFGRPPMNGLEYIESPSGDIEVPDQTFGVWLYRKMMMVDPIAFQYGNHRKGNPDPLDRIRRGEVWRLITPLLLHGGIMHLVFNMLMMYSLGGVIERLHGSLFLLLMIVITGVVATLVQAYAPAFLGGTPRAIGASGAILGLFGYLWVRPMVQPNYPVRIPQSTVVMVLGFALLCMTPMIPNIANAAHVGGFLAGIALIPLAIRLWPFP